MANYINKYENATAYDADKAKQYPNVSYIEETDKIVWQKKRDYSQDYLTFVALEDGTFKFSGNSIDYSIDDGQTWTALASDTDTPTITAGNKILWKASGLIPSSSSGIGKFIASGQFDVEGNIMSLESGDSFVNATAVRDKEFIGLFNGAKIVNAEKLVLPATTLALYCYNSMFKNCTSLTKAPELPAMTLASNCYQTMFQNCTSLTAAPELPATTLVNNCYASMFAGCTSLTTAPELPATTLVKECYYNMFNGCTSLATAPELPATTLATNCYFNLFNGCTSLATAPVLAATTLAEGCYRQMFASCTSLTTAPALPASALVKTCYFQMFNACSNLNNITCLATDISASQCTTAWIIGIPSSGTFTKAASMSSWTTGNDGIPSGWTVVDAQ